MIIRAPAKLNLTFQIVAKREDGYHDILSVMQTVDIFDYLTIEKAAGYSLTGAQVSTVSESLVTRAVRAVEHAVGRSLPVSIKLDKVIPIGAGLGGGSSDAASTMIALWLLYELNIEATELLRIGAEVGSDVPFFLRGGKCLVEGRGEIVTPLEPEKGNFFYLVFRPHRRLSSREAYEEYDRTGKTFEQQAREKCPQLGALVPSFGPGVVSGKGPATWVQIWSYGPPANALDTWVRNFDGDIFWCRSFHAVVNPVDDVGKETPSDFARETYWYVGYPALDPYYAALVVDGVANIWGTP